MDLSTILDPIERRRAAARRIIVHQGDDDVQPLVYVVRRIRSEDLQAPGVAEILGPGALASARAQQEEEEIQAQMMRGATTPEAEASVREQIRQMTEARNGQLLAEITGDETRTRALLARCEAYVRAAVEAVGLARPGVAHGLQPPGTTPADVCLTVDGRQILRPVRFVPGPEAGAGELPLSEVPVAERLAVGLLVIAAVEVASSVRPFPGPAGAADHG